MDDDFWFVDESGVAHKRQMTDAEKHLYRSAYRRGVVETANTALHGGMITNDQKSDLYAAIWPNAQG